MEREERLDTLENLLDESSVPELLKDLIEICQFKAQYLREHWQNERGAQYWTRISKSLNQTLLKLTAR